MNRFERIGGTGPHALIRIGEKSNQRGNGWKSVRAHGAEVFDDADEISEYISQTDLGVERGHFPGTF